MRAAIVTGGGRGLGRAISLALGADGLRVAVCYASHAADAAEVVSRIRDSGADALAIEADVSRQTQVQAMVEQVLSSFGRLDILVNNAGVASKSGTVDLSEDEWDRVLDVNLKGAFLCSQAAVPWMIRQGGGRIVNIASVAGQTGGAIGPHYAASKAGMIGLTRFMARELGPASITVNAIAPAGILTDMLRQLDLKGSARPIPRAGTPMDVGAAVRFLASEDAGFITGQVLAVNGGSFIG